MQPKTSKSTTLSKQHCAFTLSALLRAILSGSQSSILIEQRIESALIVKAAGKHDVNDFPVSAAQKLLGVRNAQRINVFPKRTL